MTGNDNFCLSLTDFEENIKISWQKSHMEYDFCDVTLSCEDKQIKTHKLIISSFSPVLRNILKLNQASHPLIYLRRVKFRNLQNLLSFMYQGEVNIAEEDLPSFLEVAEDLNVSGLCRTNSEDSDPNKEKTSQVTNSNIHPSSNEKITTETVNLKNVNNDDSVGPFTKFEQPPQNALIKASNDMDIKAFFVPKEIVENIQHKGVSTVSIKDAEGNHQCGQCDYKTKKMSHLLTHTKSIHEGVRYPCHQCNYKATQKSRLTQHIKSIHDGDRYPCHMCDHKATVKSNLIQHIKSVHECEPYQCSICAYKATQKDHLHEHQLRMHN